MMKAPTAPRRFPLLGHAIPLIRRPLEYVDALHRHGSVVKVYFGPLPVYFITDAELVHQILVTDTSHFGKGRIFDKVKRFLGEGILITEGQTHLKHRRLIKPEFNPRRLRDHATSLRQAATDQANTWKPGAWLNVVDEMFAIAVNAIAGLIFPGTPNPHKIAILRVAMDRAMKGSVIRTVTPTLLTRIPLPANHRYEQALHTFHRTIDELSEPNSPPPDGTDLVTLLRTTPVPGTDHPMSPQARHDELVSLFAAGTENIAAILSWTLHELASHPDIEARLHTELDRVLGSHPIEYDDLVNLPCLNAVVQETMRLHGIWMFMRRTLTTVELGGVRIPAGAEVAYSLHALHRDPRVFLHPSAFDPDRWLSDEIAALPKYRFMPFGAGAHKCIGDALSITEASIAIATIASSWTLRHASPAPVREDATTNVVFPHRLIMSTNARVPELRSLPTHERRQ
jgi:cytochrome P450